jgi:flavoprotein
MDNKSKIAYLKKGQHIEGLDKEAEIRVKDVTIGYPVYDGRPELASIQTLLLNKDLTNNCINTIQYSIGDSLVTRARQQNRTEVLGNGLGILVLHRFRHTVHHIGY